MINPKTRGHRGQAEQDFRAVLTTFSATVRRPALGLRAVAARARVRPAGATHPAPRPLQAAPPGPGRAEHLGTAHRERPAGRRLGGTGSSGGLAHCNAIWVVFPGPSLSCSAPSPCPRSACGPGSAARGPGVRGEPAENRWGRLPHHALCGPGTESTRRWSSSCGRGWPRALSRAGEALPSPSLRPLSGDASCYLRRGRQRLRPHSPAGKRSGAALGSSDSLLPAPGTLSRSPLCPRCLATGKARSPAFPDTHPDRFSDLYPERVPAVTIYMLA